MPRRLLRQLRCSRGELSYDTADHTNAVPLIYRLRRRLRQRAWLLGICCQVTAVTAAIRFANTVTQRRRHVHMSMLLLVCHNRRERYHIIGRYRGIATAVTITGIGWLLLSLNTIVGYRGLPRHAAVSLLCWQLLPLRH